MVDSIGIFYTEIAVGKEISPIDGNKKFRKSVSTSSRYVKKKSTTVEKKKVKKRKKIKNVKKTKRVE